jgi:hypothetical protein
MAMENVIECHTTANEEEATIALNLQSGNSDNNGSDKSRCYESPEDELGYLFVIPTFYKNKKICANRSAYKNAYQIVVHMKNFQKK